MTVSLRDDVADILEGLARAHVAAGGCDEPSSSCPATAGFRGAETLRWVEELGLDVDDSQIAKLEQNLEDYETALGTIRDLIDAQLVKETALTPAKFRDAIEVALADLLL